MATGVTGYGVLPEGFYAKPLATIDDEIDEDLRGILGESAGTDADGKIPLESMAGQLKALLVDGFSAHWDLMEAVHSSVDPSQNTGQSQDAIASISGSERQGARRSVATGICIGTALTVLPAGRVAVVANTGARFATLRDVTISAASAWAATTSYVVGNIVTNASRVYLCITAGVSDGSGGPTTTSSDITDNTVHWKYLGEGSAYVTTPFQAEDAGAIGALAGHMTGIATPVSGWNIVINNSDATVGATRETDSAFRIRREQELAAAGNATPDAIRANILQVNEGSTDPAHEPATACKVFYNDTDETDADGMPPHSVEVLVQGGTTADIAQAVWESVGAGTRTFGTRSDVVTDSEGNSQTVYWSRPDEVLVYVGAVGRYDSSKWPAGNNDSVVAQAMLSALLTYTADYEIATDVRVSPLMGAFMRGPAGTTGGVAIVPADSGAVPVVGLLEVDPLYIGISGASGTSQISISRREIAVFDSARCAITASSEEP